MESHLSFLTSRAPAQVAPPSGDSTPAASSHRTAADGRDFADVLTGESLKAQRQHFAVLGGHGPTLQVLPLGSKLNLITSDAPLPDLDSLAQFARQQGLDEAAVQALFGVGLATTALPVAGLSTFTPVAAAAPAVGADMQVAPLLNPSTTLASASPADWAAAGIEINVQLQAPLGGTSPLIAPAPVLTQPTPPAPNGHPSVAALTNAAATMPTLAPQLAAGITAAASVQASLMPMTAQAWVGVGATAPVDATTAPATDLAAQDAVRLTLAMPAPEITKRLAQMSGTGKESTWAALLASGPASKDLIEPATEVLTLDVPPDYDLGMELSSLTRSESTSSETPLPAGAVAQQGVAQAAAGGNANSNAQAQAEHRAQQFQQMAEQMGHAAAQRLIAQIERGQWKMQMRMQPASLGNIQVELDMHSGGLDALFSADSAVTRELMAQGSNKLRDTLTNSGMTVASVTVNGDQTRQSGGNSTPGKGRSTPPAMRPLGGPMEAAALAPKAAPMTPTDGLNVLA